MFDANQTSLIPPFRPFDSAPPPFEVPPRVHPPETKSHPEPPPLTPSHSDPRPTDNVRPDENLRDISFRHSGWIKRRIAVRQALIDNGVPAVRLGRFSRCGSNCWIACDPLDPDRIRIIADYCHDRFCLPCSLARSRIIAGNLGKVVTDQPHRFITLTLRSTDEPLTTLLKRLYHHFARMRRRNHWKRHVDGGAAFCEVTWSSASHRWHPHLHIIATGRFFPKKVLSDMWLDVTGDSYIVDLKLIRDRTATLRYITKYATKPYSESYVDEASRLSEAIGAFRGVRFCLTFGTWRGVKLTECSDETAWRIVASLSEVRTAAAHGIDWALKLLSRVLALRPWLDTPPSDPTFWDD